MTFEEAMGGGYVPLPMFWCGRHSPPEDLEISRKMPIHFDTMELFKTRREKRILFKCIRQALGIAKSTHITEGFAHTLFRKLACEQLAVGRNR